MDHPQFITGCCIQFVVGGLDLVPAWFLFFQQGPGLELSSFDPLIRLISNKKTISQMQPRMNFERLLVYINLVVRYVTNCVLNYGYGTTSVGSR